ncbi:hypothetical protein OGATHE_002252 [Ogataea polymorpha]|uniref:Uncharacterized protein n=1 Tax=Ogataea polymorpha TaxID=460523 RepID=A0A9P8PIS9_9ASCO|nr:hypothetical protein OGATHE_002252 [Ogataea polymorpha]
MSRAVGNHFDSSGSTGSPDFLISSRMLRAAGCLTEPPMSDPIPNEEPLRAPMAASPPEDPPLLRNRRLWGFRVRPHIVFTVSEYIIPEDVLVLQIIIAPSRFSSFTIAESSVATSSARPTNPIDVANPFKLMLSLRETTIPWRGPTNSFFCSRKRSCSMASFKASSNLTSVIKLASP